MKGLFSIGRAALAGVLDGCMGLIERGRSLLVEDAGDRAGGLSPEHRARAIDSLEGDLDCLVDDAAERGITERSAGELLLTVAILGWLRGGELPGRGAVDFMERHVAAMNQAGNEEEIELRDALRAVLEELAGAQLRAMAAGRWSERDLDAETAQERRLRRFGRNLDGLRRSSGLTIGELAERAEMDVVNVVAYIAGAEEPGAEALRALAGALSIDVGELFPPESASLDEGLIDDKVIGEVPGTDRLGEGADPDGEDREAGR